MFNRSNLYLLFAFNNSICVFHFIFFNNLFCSNVVIASTKSGIRFDATHLSKIELKVKAHEMFMHGYNGYMKFAFPHDELMPVSCKGRERGVTPSRGDVDDSLGNFSLTLVDTLDTLVVVGEYDEFEKAVKLVVDNVQFDSDLIVSVFETNIRMVGGLISGHLMSLLLKNKDSNRLQWYSDELLKLAATLSDRLLPAFNTTSGVPHSRINLKRGLAPELKNQPDTCTACGGTIILEWAALSRLTGNPIYEKKARRAMDFLWNQRNRGSDLMGTVLNVNSGDWIRRDSGIGAGIDSYYEYTLKAYILLGEEDYLYRFNKHYDAIVRYLNKGSMFIDVHMHKPTIASRSFMDALLAFWPGVQVLKGDLKGAIEMHEMLYSVVKKHKFLPDAFTHDLQVHWAQHPLRPEFIESTYFLYRATKDPHYLEVAKQVMTSLEENVRTTCGFAAVKDVRTMDHEDQMESFVLAETFKYLYMIFAEPTDLIFDPDNYVLTTEAHFLPLSIGEASDSKDNLLPRRLLIDPNEIIEDENREKKRFKSACPNVLKEFRNTNEIHFFGVNIRKSVNKFLGNFNVLNSNMEYLQTRPSCSKATERLKAWAFSATNIDHLAQLRKMGIQVEIHSDGRLQLSHSTQAALNDVLAHDGTLFMQEMTEIMQEQEKELNLRIDRTVQIVSQPHFGHPHFIASPAQFGAVLTNSKVEAEVFKAEPFQGCSTLQNAPQLKGKIVIIRRGGCMFQEKARHVQNAGGVGVIIIDNQVGTSVETAPLFAMSADTNTSDDIQIPVVFLFHLEGIKLINQLINYPTMILRVAEKVANPTFLFEQYLLHGKYTRRQLILENKCIVLNKDRTKIQFNFQFDDVNEDSDPKLRQMIVEKNLNEISKTTMFLSENAKQKFFHYARILAYSLLGYAHQMTDSDFQQLRLVIRHMELISLFEPRIEIYNPQRSIICDLKEPKNFSCNPL